MTPLLVRRGPCGRRDRSGGALELASAGAALSGYHDFLPDAGWDCHLVGGFEQKIEDPAFRQTDENLRIADDDHA